MSHAFILFKKPTNLEILTLVNVLSRWVWHYASSGGMCIKYWSYVSGCVFSILTHGFSSPAVELTASNSPKTAHSKGLNMATTQHRLSLSVLLIKDNVDRDVTNRRMRTLRRREWAVRECASFDALWCSLVCSGMSGLYKTPSMFDTHLKFP